MNLTNNTQADRNTDPNRIASDLINDLFYLAGRFDQFRIAFELNWKSRGAVPGNQTTAPSPLAVSTDNPRTNP